MNATEWNKLTHSPAAQAYKTSGAWMNKTTSDFAQLRAQQMPDRIAVVEGDRRLSYAFLLAEARRLAAGLRDLGLRKGDVISFQLPNWWESMVVNLAASLGGWAVNPIVPIYRDAEVGVILNDCKAKVIFVPQQFRGMDYVAMLRRIADEGGAKPLVVIVRAIESAAGAPTYENIGVDSAPWAHNETTPDDLKLVLYTSGTTGRPKGVLHSHNTLMAELQAVTDFWHTTDIDVVIMPSPVTHITGYTYALEYVFFRGIKVVLMERWDAQQAIALIQAEEATITVGATPFLAELTAAVESAGARLPSFRLFASGGAPVPPDLVLRASRAMPGCLVCRVYGSSESPTVTLGINSAADQERAAFTDGKVFNNEVRIVDPETGNPLGVDEIGEIVVRGPEVMLGYSSAADTQDAFDAQGFFRTGDLGRLSTDGFITVTGRKKDLIIRGGENLSPKEVEDLLHAHPDVLEAAVVAMPHARLGETPCAYVVLKFGKDMNLGQMAAYLDTQRLARQKFPEQLFVVDALPKTASGKILKHILRARAAEIFTGNAA